MTQIHNLNKSTIPDILHRVGDVELGTPLNHSAIGKGGLLVYGGGGITIENDGGLKVTGTAEIIGRLLATGIIDFMGEVNISGPLVVEDGGSVTIGSIEMLPDGSAKFGTLTIDPDGKITTGTAEINPDGSAKFGDLAIDTEGKVTAGGMTIDPDLFGGSVQFAAGGYLSGTASGPQLTGPLGNAFVYVRNALAGIQAAVISLVGDVTVQGRLQVTNPGIATGVTPNVYLDAAGNLKKIV